MKLTEVSNLNVYGDNVVSTTGTHGVDVASQRLDDLDKQALIRLLSHSGPRETMVDLGCGLGWQGVRFAMLGARSFLFDLLPEASWLRTVRKEAHLDIQYRSLDLRAATPDDFPDHIDLAFAQRFIHYLRFAEADQLIKNLAQRMPPGSHFYISASGLYSELGSGYRAAAADVEERYAQLSMEMQSRHQIREPVCLFSEGDLARLMNSNGFNTSRLWTSAFGNIKGIFQRTD